MKCSVWQCCRGLREDTLEGHRDRVWSVAVLPGGGGGGHLCLCCRDPQSLEMIGGRDTCERDTLEGHDSMVFCVIDATRVTAVDSAALFARPASIK